MEWGRASQDKEVNELFENSKQEAAAEKIASFTVECVLPIAIAIASR